MYALNLGISSSLVALQWTDSDHTRGIPAPFFYGTFIEPGRFQHLRDMRAVISRVWQAMKNNNIIGL